MAMQLVKNDAAPKPQPSASAARTRLAELQAKVDECNGRLKGLEESLARLESIARDEAAATATLSNFDADEGAAMAAWARTAIGSPPEPNVRKREKLEAAARTAAARAAPARQAHASIAALRHAESRTLKDLETPIALEIAAALVEEAGPLLEDFEQLNRVLSAKANRIQALSESLVNVCHNGVLFEQMRPAFMLMEKLQERIRNSLARPVPDEILARQDRAALAIFIAQLRTDAAARLELSSIGGSPIQIVMLPEDEDL
jgi:hypothetical protein